MVSETGRPHEPMVSGEARPPHQCHPDTDGALIQCLAARAAPCLAICDSTLPAGDAVDGTHCVGNTSASSLVSSQRLLLCCLLPCCRLLCCLSTVAAFSDSFMVCWLLYLTAVCLVRSPSACCRGLCQWLMQHGAIRRLHPLYCTDYSPWRYCSSLVLITNASAHH